MISSCWTFFPDFGGPKKIRGENHGKKSRKQFQQVKMALDYFREKNQGKKKRGKKNEEKSGVKNPVLVLVLVPVPVPVLVL